MLHKTGKRIHFFLAALVCMALWLVSPWQAGAGKSVFMPDELGRVDIDIEQTNRDVHGLTRADAAAVEENLRRLRDLLMNQRLFHPLRGVRVRGYARLENERAASRLAPIPAYVYMQFFPAFMDRQTGKLAWRSQTPYEITAYLNKPAGGLEPLDAPGLETPLFFEPLRTTAISGFPVFSGRLGCEYIVLGRKTGLPWMPVTREEFLRLWARIWEKKALMSPNDPALRSMAARPLEILDMMKDEDRKAQARYFPQARANDPAAPPLAPAGSIEGLPLVKENPAWYDPALPRTAVQLVSVRFWYAGDLSADRPGLTKEGNPAPLRVWETLHRSDWTRVSTILGGSIRGASGK